jgi:hypothetical protein
MKKSLYTLSFLTLFTLAANAQSAVTPVKQEKENGAKKVDGAKQTAPEKKTAEPVKQEKATNESKGTTRMAITEKGVPASTSSKEAKATKAGTKEEKKTESPQPAAASTTEKPN